ncbi:hypothetical protein U1E44_15115 [Arenibacter sp. GZD96]|uniref:hypothetical protein n=1 Tax=Aurantibrevibacter litoralis TaxID=3106030 RepID=UPI002AFF1933|nr:hypothetical protein [Arenibacter sp. GZD-96]MEA1787430.1 hypothetical protein [Arenibacter sp. GZD-96]
MKFYPFFLYVTLSFIIFSASLVSAQSTENLPATKIVVQNLYYPKPGLETEVFQWRLHASAVRAKLQLPVGRVLQRIDTVDGQPYVIWECEYPNLDARAADVEKIGESKEFEEVQQHMGTLLAKFERSVWYVH